MLTSENKQGLASLLDDMIKFNNPILEAIDGAILKGIIGGLESNLFDKIPVKLHEEINHTVKEILEKDYEQAVDELMQLLAIIMNTYITPKIETALNPHPVDDDIDTPNTTP